MIIPALRGAAGVGSLTALAAVVLALRTGRTAAELVSAITTSLAIYGLVAAIATLPGIAVGVPVIALAVCAAPWLAARRGRPPTLALLCCLGVGLVVLARWDQLFLLVPFATVPTVAAATALVLQWRAGRSAG